MDNDNDILNDLDSFSETEESKKKEVKKEDKVSENKEVIAMIAYLQRLGKDITLADQIPAK